MNIFYLSLDARDCAEQHCDQHVIKMITEYGQLLSTAHRVLDGKEEVRFREGTNHKYKYWVHPSWESSLYKASHVNHPAGIWVRQSAEHYMYLYNLMLWCNHEFVYRYGKQDDHLVICKLKGELSIPPMALWNVGGFIDPPQCMPEQYRDLSSTIQAYRNFYIGDKVSFATYKKRSPPSWYLDALRSAHDRKIA